MAEKLIESTIIETNYEMSLFSSLRWTGTTLLLGKSVNPYEGVSGGSRMYLRQFL